MPFLLPISHQGDHTPAAESMIAVLLLAAAFQPPSPATLVGSDRRAVRMCSAEDAARERWLKNSGRGQRPPPENAQDAFELQKAARERMLSAMGGESEALQNGAGVMYGFGMPDDENYGYGPPKMPERPQREQAGEDKFVPEWMTHDPVGANDRQRKIDEGFLRGETTRGGEQQGLERAPLFGYSLSCVAHSLATPSILTCVPGGFDGRPEGWSRKVETNDPNPPPMANTLRSPGAYSKPAQTFEYDFETGFEDVQRGDEQEAQAEEDDLLDSLMGAMHGSDES